jgi:hypothetical protein
MADSNQQGRSPASAKTPNSTTAEPVTFAAPPSGAVTVTLPQGSPARETTLIQSSFPLTKREEFAKTIGAAILTRQAARSADALAREAVKFADAILKELDRVQ